VTRLPSITAKIMEAALFKLGFKRVRQKGSHAFYRHPDGRTTTVPHHVGRDLARPLVHDILQDIGLSSDEFKDVLDSL